MDLIGFSVFYFNASTTLRLSVVGSGDHGSTIS